MKVNASTRASCYTKRLEGHYKFPVPTSPRESISETQTRQELSSVHLSSLSLCRGVTVLLRDLQDFQMWIVGITLETQMGGCQNYGPFLGPYCNTAPNI